MFHLSLAKSPLKRSGVESRPTMCDEDLPRISWGIADPRTAGGA